MPQKALHGADFDQTPVSIIFALFCCTSFFFVGSVTQVPPRASSVFPVTQGIIQRALAKTASESIEAIVRKRRILFAGFVARMGEERLPQRVMFGKLVGGKAYSGGQEKDWMAHLKEDMLVFGMKFEGWRKAAQKTGRWFRRADEGAELFMRNWHET